MVVVSLAKNEEKEQKKYWKSIFLVSLTSLVLLVLGWSSASIIFSQKIFGFSPFWFLFSALISFLIIFPLGAILSLENPWLIILIESLFFSLGFIWRSHLIFSWKIYLLLLLILFLTLFLSYATIKNKTREILRLKWREITRTGLNFTLTGLALFFSLSYYFSINQNQKFFLTEKSTFSLLKITNPIIQIYYPSFNWQMTFNEFSQMVIGTKIKALVEENLGDYGKFLPPALIEKEKEAIIKQNLEIFREQAEKSLGIEIKDEDKLSQIVYQALFYRFNLLSPSWHRYLQILVLLALFTFLKFFSIFLLWIAQFLGYFFFQILLAINFISIVYEPRTKETVVFT